MGAEQPTLYGTQDSIARLEILDCASEDCYWVIQFIENLRHIYAELTEHEKREAIARVYRGMVDEGVVRLHRGDQCTGDKRTGDDLTLASDQVGSALQDIWSFRFGVDTPTLCVCDTTLTQDAYKSAYLGAHRGSA